MTDVHTKEQRSYNMSKIKRNNTKSELKLKGLLRHLGFAYQPKNMYGNPDFVNYKFNSVVFIDGCFWHRCPRHFIKPRSNSSYWNYKIKKNLIRDFEVTMAYLTSGWNVSRIWEHELLKNPYYVIKILEKTRQFRSNNFFTTTHARSYSMFLS